MPIPEFDNVSIESPEELDKEYFKLGWVREIEFPWISYEPRIQIYISSTYKAAAQNFPCLCQGPESKAGARFTYFKLTSTGLVRTCGLCRKTDTCHQLEKFQLLNSRRVSRLEAKEICKMTGQREPAELKDNQRFAHAKKLLDLNVW